MSIHAPLVVLDLPADASAPRLAREAIGAAVEQLGGEVPPVALAVSEAVTNAVVHAYREITPGRVRLFADHDEDGVNVIVEDDGVGIARRADSPGMGIGLPTIATLTERFEIEGGASGTRLIMRFTLERQRAEAA